MHSFIHTSSSSFCLQTASNLLLTMHNVRSLCMSVCSFLQNSLGLNDFSSNYAFLITVSRNVYCFYFNSQKHCKNHRSVVNSGVVFSYEMATYEIIRSVFTFFCTNMNLNVSDYITDGILY